MISRDVTPKMMPTTMPPTMAQKSLLRSSCRRWTLRIPIDRQRVSPAWQRSRRMPFNGLLVWIRIKPLMIWKRDLCWLGKGFRCPSFGHLLTQHKQDAWVIFYLFTMYVGFDCASIEKRENKITPIIPPIAKYPSPAKSPATISNNDIADNIGEININIMHARNIPAMTRRMVFMLILFQKTRF